MNYSYALRYFGFYFGWPRVYWRRRLPGLCGFRIGLGNVWARGAAILALLGASFLLICHIVFNQPPSMAAGDVAVVEDSSTLPTVVWEEVYPNRLLPVVDRTFLDLSTSFKNEAGVRSLIAQLQHPDTWVAAHVTLVALFRSDDSFSPPRYLTGTKRDGLHLTGTYDAMIVDVTYMDDGFCIRRIVEYPNEVNQRKCLHQMWSDRLVDLNHALHAIPSPRLAVTAMQECFRHGPNNVTPDEVQEFWRNVLADGVQWRTHGFGTISPGLSKPASEMLHDFTPADLIALFTLLREGESDQWPKAHVMLSVLLDPFACELPQQREATGPLEVFVNDLSVNLTYRPTQQTFEVSFRNDRSTRSRCVSYWESVFKSAGVEIED